MVEKRLLLILKVVLTAVIYLRETTENYHLFNTIKNDIFPDNLCFGIIIMHLLKQTFMGFLIIFLLTVLQQSPIPPPLCPLSPSLPLPWPSQDCGVCPWTRHICSMDNLILGMSSQVSLSVFHKLTDIYVYKYYLFLFFP